MRYASKKTSGATPATGLPTRGIWAIDQLKRLSGVEELHVVGIDAGKRELVVGAGVDDPRKGAIRHTQKERLRDLRSVQKAYEAKKGGAGGRHPSSRGGGRYEDP